MIYQAGAYLRFSTYLEVIRVFLLPLDGMLIHHWATPDIRFTGAQLINNPKWGEAM